LEGPRDDKAFAHAVAQLAPGNPSTSTVVSGYPTLTSSGQPLKSDTVIFRDGAGVAFAALCINSDMTVFKAAQSWLEKVLGYERRANFVQSAKRPQVDALTQEILDGAIRTFGKPIGMLSRAEKIGAAEHMLRSGVFMMRGGVERAATALGVTRFTICNYLEEIRRRDGSG
jgi:predicted transcriptional regulator YheO